jgi:Transposase, Mutator family
MTTRDIKAHLLEVYGVDVSHETVAKVTDVVVEEVRNWQSRPVDEGQFLLVVANPSRSSSVAREPRSMRGKDGRRLEHVQLKRRSCEEKVHRSRETRVPFRCVRLQERVRIRNLLQIPTRVSTLIDVSPGTTSELFSSRGSSAGCLTCRWFRLRAAGRWRTEPRD